MKNVCVIIPSLNPDERLKGVVDGVLAEGFTDIILVDDGSLEENKKFFPENEYVSLLVHEQNRGKGAALKTALEWVYKNRPDAIGVVTCDGDGQHTPKDTLRVAQKMVESDKFTLGVRDFSLDNVPARSRIGNRLSSLALYLCAGSYITDTQTGLRAIPYRLIDKMLKISGDRFEYETNVLLELRSMGAEYTEVKIETVYLDENKSSHFRPFRDTVRIMSLMLKYAASSCASFLTDIIIFSLLHSVASLGILVSTVIARVISSILNFTLNKKLVFKSHEPFTHTILKYYAIAIPTMLISAFGTGILSSLLGVPESSLIITLIKIVVDTLLFVINFKIQKRWIFKKG